MTVCTGVGSVAVDAAFACMTGCAGVRSVAVDAAFACMTGCAGVGSVAVDAAFACMTVCAGVGHQMPTLHSHQTFGDPQGIYLRNGKKQTHGYAERKSFFSLCHLKEN